MLHLQGPQMLQMLKKSLWKSLPESLKIKDEVTHNSLPPMPMGTSGPRAMVYGTVFHMNRGNPFRLKALVDKWPDFNTVVIRPPEQEMTDDLDHYTNTYQIYSKDPKNCQEFLGLPEVINWKQHLQIQSSQSSLDEVIENLVAIKLGKVKRTQCLLYMASETTKKLVLSLLDAKNLTSNGGKHKSINQETFKLSSLDVTHAALVNKFWYFGGNERSQRFIERCIRVFPTSCLLGPQGTPVSWCLMDQTGEVRMAGTMPEHRTQGLVSQVVSAQIQAMDKLGFPMYCHVDRANHIMQRVNFTLQIVSVPCDWNQWNCVPL